MTTQPTADLDRLSFHEGVLLIAGVFIAIAGIGFAWICVWERWGGRFGHLEKDREEWPGSLGTSNPFRVDYPDDDDDPRLDQVNGL